MQLSHLESPTIDLTIETFKLGMIEVFGQHFPLQCLLVQYRPASAMWHLKIELFRFVHVRHTEDI